MTGASGSSDDCVYGYPQGVPYPRYVLVPGSPRRPRVRKSYVVWSAFKLFLVALLIVSLAALGYMLFPRKVEVDVKKISLENINLHVDETKSVIPMVYVDVSLDLRLKITNANFFGVLYDKLAVEFFYREDNLGRVESSGGEVPSRSVVMATAKLELLGAPLLDHATELIADVSNREVPLQTVTEFTGALEMFSFRPKIKVKVYCDLIVEPIDKDILSKSCSLLPFPLFGT